jgi:chorismate dehydratase
MSVTGLTSPQDPRLRIAAIDFLNPAPLMWDFEHAPLAEQLAERYRIDRMVPSECARRLAEGEADLGLIPIAALATSPHLRVLPGCTIASKGHIRSLLLVRRADQPISAIRTVAADTASRTTNTYARILFRLWGNPQAEFRPMQVDLDAMLAEADAAVVIGDPALYARQDMEARLARTGEKLVYYDMAEEWRKQTGLPFISAVWCAAAARGTTAWGNPLDERIAEDCIRSRDHGLQHIDDLVAEWAPRMKLPAEVLRDYLGNNLHYVLDDECIEGMRGFYRYAAEFDILPQYDVLVPSP